MSFSRLFSRSLLAATLCALIASPSAPAAAQGTTSPYGNRSNPDASAGVYTPPAVFVTTVVLQSPGPNGDIPGTFTVRNEEPANLGDLRYRLSLVGPLPAASDGEALVLDTAETFDQQLSPTTLALTAQAEATIPFTYSPPAVPPGPYRLRVQMLTSKGRELGWQDTAIVLTKPAGNFVSLMAGTIGVPEFPNEVIPPIAGPNVPPGSTVTLRATAINRSPAAVTVTPVLTLYPFDSARARISETPLGSPLTLRAGQTQQLDLPAVALSDPGVYYGVVTLQEAGVRVSNLAEYRWVVRGKDAEIISARLLTLGQHNGSPSTIEVDFAGPGDAETTFQGTLLVELHDDSGLLGSQTVSNLSLTDAVQTAPVPVAHQRALAGAPQAKITIMDETGSVLDEYTVPFSLTPEQQAAQTQPAAAPSGQPKIPLSILFILIGLAVVILAVAMLYRRMRPAPIDKPLVSILALVTTGLVAATTVSAIGNNNGVTVNTPVFDASQTGYGIEIFVNQPTHDRSTAYDRTNVPLAFRVASAVCRNGITAVRNVVRYAPEGGKHSSWRPAAGTSWHNVINAEYEINGDELCQSHWCRSSTTFVAPNGLNLSQLQDEATSTTLQVMGLYNWGATAAERVTAWEEHETSYLRYHDAHAVNVWLNVAAKPTPTPDPQCNDARDNDSDNRVDCADPGCWTNRLDPNSCNPADNDESDPECSDARDNDGDGTVDRNDIGCRTNPTDPTTYDPNDPTEADPVLSPGPIQETE